MQIHPLRYRSATILAAGIGHGGPERLQTGWCLQTVGFVFPTLQTKWREVHSLQGACQGEYSIACHIPPCLQPEERVVSLHYIYAHHATLWQSMLSSSHACAAQLLENNPAPPDTQKHLLKLIQNQISCYKNPHHRCNLWHTEVLDWCVAIDAFFTAIILISPGKHI